MELALSTQIDRGGDERSSNEGERMQAQDFSCACQAAVLANRFPVSLFIYFERWSLGTKSTS